MSEPAPITYALSTRNLTLDGTRVVAGEHGETVEVDAYAALAALDAFQQLTALESLEAEARLYLAGPAGKVAVQNVGGRLVAVLVPEAANVAVTCTPEAVIALATAGPEAVVSAEPGFSSAEAAASELMSDSPRRGSVAQRTLNSPWFLAGLVGLALVVAYVVFAPKVPVGVILIRDQARIAALHGELNGRYGSPGATVLELANGKLTGRAGGPDGAVLFELSYRYGLRDAAVVLVAANQAELKIQTDGTLLFLSSSYPRQNAK